MWNHAGHWKSALLAVLATGLVACGEDPVGPGSDPAPADIAITEDLELQVAVDDVVAEVIIEDAALFAGDSPSSGPWAEARELFRQARQAWRNGDTELAAELAMQGRLVISQAILDKHGEEGLDALFKRVEDLLARLDGASDQYERLADLAERMAELLDEATVLRDDGDLVGAGERLILALGMADRMRHRHQDARRHAHAHAEAAVSAATIIYQRVVEEVGPEPGFRVAHALAHARELLRRANVALDNHAYRRAIILSRRSVGWSFLALRLSLL
ncbi:MAG: putative nuclear RNA export factor SDE5 [Gemmatimonadota bacterium]|nr:putative nuclear RNA export factor SDE5 [Gemmatimonadota bacterium]